jgi:hypothetical protein
MSDETYNYSVFDVSLNPFSEFINFATHAPKVTMRAPSFPLEDLATGEKSGRGTQRSFGRNWTACAWQLLQDGGGVVSEMTR